MTRLIEKTLQLHFVPSVIQRDFEQQVLEIYCDFHWHDLYNITGFLESFSVYSVSYSETGDPYYYVDNEIHRYILDEIITDCKIDLMCDTKRVLDHHHIFYAWEDLGRDGHYDLKIDQCENIPIMQVW